MLVHLVLCILSTIDLHSIFVNNYLLYYSYYTKVSDRHTCLIHPFLKKDGYISRTRQRNDAFMFSIFYLVLTNQVMK